MKPIQLLEEIVKSVMEDFAKYIEKELELKEGTIVWEDL